jgi:ubiquinone/menaquinone biosynthesis C-methylase UbiE
MLVEPSRARPDADVTQSAVDRHFDRSSAFWHELYGGTDVYSAIHRRRQQLALAWIDEYGMPAQGRALELGCGAGFTAIALARRGWHVHATDTVASMLARARANAAAAGVADRITFGLADAQRLTFEDASFDLVLALGVIPWLAMPAQAVSEMARVARIGGAVVVNADNRSRLDYAIDPRRDPRLAPVRSAVKALLRRRRVTAGAPSQLHAVAEFDAMLAAAGVEKRRGAVFGFGPFTVLGRHALPDAVGVRVDRFLQQRADAGSRALARRGAQYLVLGSRRPTAAASTAPPRRAGAAG